MCQFLRAKQLKISMSVSIYLQLFLSSNLKRFFFSLLDGKLVPKGCNIAISPYFMGRNPKNFTDPDKFIPERFKVTDGDTKRNPFLYIPFSAGKYFHKNCFRNFYLINYILISRTAKLYRSKIRHV